jgi:hypothetical protein
VYYERVVGWSALGGENFSGKERIKSQGTETIDSLCQESNNLACCQVFNSRRDGFFSL